MDGVFMRKLLFVILIFCLLTSVPGISELLSDRVSLRENIIRLHVVADSDSPEDQQIKLKVRDAVTAYLETAMSKITDQNEAQKFIQENLEKIAKVANSTLESLGAVDTARVNLGPEAFGTRIYDTFSLPAGVYDSLRITIGNGEGKNWWCVVFPSLCLPATAAEFEQEAVACGMTDNLADTLSGEEGYEFRFFLLDCLGQIENFFHRA